MRYINELNYMFVLQIAQLLGFCSGGEAAKAWSWPLTSIYYRG